MNPSFARSSLWLAAAALLTASPLLRAADPAPDVINGVPIVSADEAVQKELLSLDRLLDTNPALEEKLRTNVDHLNDETFRANNPDVDALLKQRPNLVRALHTERHFLLHRSIARLARSRVTRADVTSLDKFLTEHDDIAKALQKRPNQIVDPNFLIAHRPLADFFEAHPALSSILLQRDAKRQATKSAADKAATEKKK